jgi:hypothetical protein
MTMTIYCAALGLALAAFPGPATAAPDASPRATAEPHPNVAKGILPPSPARDLYSARARRLVRSYLRLRLLELRETDLDRARAVIEGKLGADALFGNAPTQAGVRATGR